MKSEVFAVCYLTPGFSGPAGAGPQIAGLSVVGFERDVAALVLRAVHTSLLHSVPTAFRALSITDIYIYIKTVRSTLGQGYYG